MLYHGMMKRYICLLLFSTAFFCLSPLKPANTHPHAWIDLQSSVLFDAEGKISGLGLRWTFDVLYTAFALSGATHDEAGNMDPTFINDLARENLANLEAFDYFTVMEVAGQKQSFNTVSDYATGVEGGRLWLEFILPLPTPVAPQDISYSVYDPSYYIEILHGDRLISFEGNQAAEESCSYDLKEPQPTEELISRVAALDKNQTAEDGIGRFFAEKVSVTCF